MANPKAYAQDALLCELCDASSVCVLCTKCKTNLCQSCIGPHVSSDLRRKHVIEDYKVRKRFFSCKVHKEEICELYCIKCSTPICVKCLAIEHAAHGIRHLQTFVDLKEKEIHRDINIINLELKEIYKHVKRELLDKLSSLSTTYEPLIKSIEDQENQIIQAVRIVAADFKDQVSRHRKLDEICLNGMLLDIELKNSEMEEQIQNKFRVLHSRDLDEKLQYKSSIQYDFPLPTTPHITECQFKPNKVNLHSLRTEFGRVIKTKQGNVKRSLNKVESVSTFDSSLPKLTTLNNAIRGKIWAAGNQSDLVCFDLKGNVLEHYCVHNDLKPFDFTVTIHNEVIFTLWKQRCIKIITTSRTEKILHQFDWGPKGICCTPSGEILVCLKNPNQNESKISRFENLELKLEIHKDSEGKVIFKDASFLTENINGDICVSDKEDQSLVVVTGTGKLKFKYTSIMDPHTVVSDSTGHILIIDCGNKIIHVIDEDGNFLTYLCALQNFYPHAICVDEDDRLYVGEYENGKVTVMKYLN